LSRRRLLAVGLSSVLLSGLAVSVSPGAAAVPAPTAKQLADAARKVTEAQRGLADVQGKAEMAAEAYNDAQVQAEAAAAAAEVARGAAAQAQTVADRAAVDAAAAQGVADEASTAAQLARQAHERAVAAAVAAQQALDDIAAGAYRSGGNIALLSTMLAADPMAFATGQAMINRADGYQKDRVDALTRAKADAAATAAFADQAEVTATTTARQVAERAAAAVTSAQAATRASADASAAAGVAVAAAQQAEAAKQYALVLVDAAERELGTASAKAASLAAQAEQARREAAAAQRALPPSAGPVSGSAAAIAIAMAYKQIGVPYAWGGGTARGASYGFAQGAGTLGFDCSGLMLYAWSHAGVRLDHSSRSQYHAGRHVGFEQLIPGDLIFYANDTSDPTTIHHVTMYLGGGKMIEAPHTGAVVRVANVYRRGFIGGTRLTA
jgi:cell wall-associated NlpC family hydrolase